MDDIIAESGHFKERMDANNAMQESVARLGESMDEKVARLTELQESHTKRLHILKVKSAKYGLECPASIELEIVEISEKIETIRNEIELITGTMKRLREAINDSLEYTLEEREHMISAMEKRKLKLAREEKKRDRLGEKCPPELLKQIERDRKFIERVQECYLYDIDLSKSSSS